MYNAFEFAEERKTDLLFKDGNLVFKFTWKTPLNGKMLVSLQV